MLHLLTSKLLEPFRKHFLFLISFFILATLPHSLYLLLLGDINAKALILVIMHCFVLSYAITFLVGLIKWITIQKTLKTIIIIVFSIYYAINIYCIIELGCLFDPDIAILILNTDLEEATEFLSTMLPLRTIAIVVGTYIVLIFLEISSKRSKVGLLKLLSNIAMWLFPICLASNIYAWEVWKDGPIREIIRCESYEIIPKNLKKFYSHPSMIFSKDAPRATNVVLIIGESFDRSHSSIYGYSKNTNPKLLELQKKGMLFSFDSIVSPAPTTSEAIKYMMSTYNINDSKSQKKWYEYPTLIEIIQRSGYTCYWFSNQAKGGVYEGSARAFACCCDSNWFSPKGYKQIDHYKNSKLGDIILVDSTSQFVQQLSPLKHNFIVYHLMGSHTVYRKRYPNSFSYFSSKDYLQDPQNHRETLAAYDNSILYNDFIVAQIIDLFKQKDAIVIYLPDHGQVMYRDKRFPDYYAHGRNNDSISASYGVEIPFFVYASALFQKNNPDVMERIKHRQSHPKNWNSDDLPYLIMDIIGIQKLNGKEVHDKSII